VEATGTYIVEVDNVSFGYERHRSVVSHLSFGLQPGRVYSLLGAMASGKSTVLKLLTRLLKPNSGDIRLMGIGIWDMKEVSFRRQVSIAFQYPDRSIFATTVYDEIAFALKMLYPEKKPYYSAMVEKALMSVGLNTSFLKRNPHMLSGGEKRKVSLAAAIVHEPQVLLLDEPTAGLDGRSTEAVLRFIREYAQENRVVLFTTHNLEDIDIADVVMVLHEGRIHYLDKNQIDYMDFVSYGILPPDFILYERWGKYHGYV